jgi:2-dehydro-3-deoxygluconokinase
MTAGTSMNKKVVTFGEVMLRLQPPDFERIRLARSFEALYGGAEANVAVSLANYGVPAEYVTRLPENEVGEACLAYLRQFGVGLSHVARGGDRLGIFYLEKGSAQRPSRIIYDRAGSSFATLQPGMIDWEAVLAGANWFHWTGITPAVSSSAAAVCLEAVLAARRLGLTVSTDFNYRKNLWKWGKKASEVLPELVSQCDLAIGNEEDAEKVFGIQAQGSNVSGGKVPAESYLTVAEQLAARFPNLASIAFTLRGSISASHNTWSGVLWQQGQFYTGPTYEILPIVDRVGAGDAFGAGLIYGLRRDSADPDYALRFAIAASCLKHSIPGDFNQATLAEVEQLMAGDASGRVSR